MTDNVTRLKVRQRQRMILHHSVAQHLRGITAELREIIAEQQIDLDELRGIAVRIEALANKLEGSNASNDAGT